MNLSFCIGSDGGDRDAESKGEESVFPREFLEFVHPGGRDSVKAGKADNHTRAVVPSARRSLARPSNGFQFAIALRDSKIQARMSRVHLLSDTLASQVAAGEVVERPASVVKELVENSIDAQAQAIEVRIRRGGISLIRVTDDGIGMDRDDALLCLERHATSKIRTAADLATVGTLGFRGEALPSIASVSRFRLATREKEAVAGTEVIVSGGRIETVRDGGEAPGTQVEVRSLFYNLPARRKFLRSENTETRNVEHQLNLQAIGHPGIAFSLVRDERVVFQLPAAKTLRDRIRDLMGSELLARLLEVEPAAREAAGERVRRTGGREPGEPGAAIRLCEWPRD